MAELILASSSPHRASLLSRLRIPFVVMAPAIDETPHTDELPQALVTRLAFEKAQAVLNGQENIVVIGSDQVAVCEGKIIGKPGNVENAKRLRVQSWVLRGATVLFGASVFAAYALLPIVMWFDNS